MESWLAPADRSGPAERFLTTPFSISRVVLSPDSRYAVLTVPDQNGKRDLYLTDLKGDRTPQPLEKSSFNNMGPKISPDGHWPVVPVRRERAL